MGFTRKAEGKLSPTKTAAPTEFAENAEGHIRLQVEPFTRSPCLPGIPWADRLGFVSCVCFVVPLRRAAAVRFHHRNRASPHS